jgi:DNA polymerase delta subunit 2
MAALGMETTSGDFEVIDLCFAGLPDIAKPEAGPSNANGSTKGKERAKEDPGAEKEEKTWVALASGLSVGSQEAPADFKVQLLAEWLMGETGGVSVSCVKSLS